MKRSSLILTTILVGSMTSTYAANPKDVNVVNIVEAEIINTPDVNITNTPGVTIENSVPIPVTIQNGSAIDSMQPFCPCFSTEEIDATIGDLTIVECNDDRIGTGSAPQNVSGTSMLAGPLALAGVAVGSTDNYHCTLVDENNNGIVSFDEIGFTNAMACRLAIINSSAWQRCPTTP